MQDSTLDELIHHFETELYGYPAFTVTQKEHLKRFVRFVISSGHVKEIERKNIYTFGGVTVSLTDTQFATLIKAIRDESKIQAIRLIRCEYTEGTTVSLKQAKDFVDHLGNVVSKL